VPRAGDGDLPRLPADMLMAGDGLLLVGSNDPKCVADAGREVSKELSELLWCTTEVIPDSFCILGSGGLLFIC